MRKLTQKTNQSGFITMIVCMVLIVLAVLYLAYHQVARAQH